LPPIALPLLLLAAALQGDAAESKLPPELLVRARAIAALAPTDHAPTPRSVDVVHYALRLAVDPAAGRIEGVADVELRPFATPRRTITLDADGLEVAAVKLGDATLAFTRAESRLEIDLGREVAPDETLRLSIAYAATPRRGLFFARAADGSCAMVWSQNECRMASAWFPCRDEPDDRASSELFVTLPDAWRSVGNGVLIESTALDGGRRTDHWRMDFPHPAYLASLVAGPLRELDLGRVRDLPLFGYALPDVAEKATAALQPTGRMIELLERFAGVPYPYPVYRQACIVGYPWGGMENIAATTLDQNDLHAPDAPAEERLESDALLVHEIAHQWFGDLVTPASWADLWLAEGFATYAEFLWIERTQGADSAAAAWLALQEKLRDARSGAPRPVVSSACVELDDLFTPHVYEGGAAVLRILREVVGAEKFDAAVKAWIARGQNRSVGTAEFEALFAETTGRDLAPFFLEWLHSPAQPTIECEWQWDEAGRRLQLIAHQKQQGDGVPEVYHAPLTAAWTTDGGRRTATLQLDARRCQVAVDCDARPRYVHFNVGATLPGSVTTSQKPEAWRAQLGEESDPAGRIAAARALAKAWSGLTDEEKAPTLAAMARATIEEKQPEVRAAAAAALGELEHAVGRSVLGSALWDGDARVRAAAAAGLGELDDDEVAVGLLIRRLQTEASHVVQAALMDALASGLRARAAAPLLALAQREEGSAEVRGAALAAAASCSGLPDEALTRLTKVAVAESAADRPLPRREGAIAALGSLALRSPEALAALAALLDDPLPDVRGKVLDAIAELEPETLDAALLAPLVAFHDRAALTEQAGRARMKIAKLLEKVPR